MCYKIVFLYLGCILKARKMLYLQKEEVVEDNWAEYLLLQELFEATVKQFCINGKITRNTGLKSLEKYS